MTAQRARAYARVTKLLRDVGSAKLHPDEQATIRFAIDTLLFSADLVDDRAARAACSEIYALRDDLVAAGRWSPGRADELADEVLACGPVVSTPFALAA
jgi:hypothetical protein